MVVLARPLLAAVARVVVCSIAIVATAVVPVTALLPPRLAVVATVASTVIVAAVVRALRLLAVVAPARLRLLLLKVRLPRLPLPRPLRLLRHRVPDRIVFSQTSRWFANWGAIYFDELSRDLYSYSTLKSNGI